MIKLTQQGYLELEKMGLSSTEIEICQKALIHDSQSAIGDSAFICIKTVKFHMSNIYKKLGVSKMHGLLLFLFPMSYIWEEPQPGEVRPEQHPKPNTPRKVEIVKTLPVGKMNKLFS